jgi:hypothetical protein
MQLVERERLITMRDEELINIQNIFRRKLMKVRREKGHADSEYRAQVETELNYLYRELEIREHRRKAHLEYMNARANRSRRNS